MKSRQNRSIRIVDLTHSEAPVAPRRSTFNCFSSARLSESGSLIWALSIRSVQPETIAPHSARLGVYYVKRTP